MPHIPSPAHFARLDGPSVDPGYRHPATQRRGVIPMAFQITSPLNNRMCLLPHALVLHVNPASFDESPTKKVERIQTRGGFVEQHWGDELTEISADGSTGAFMNLQTGLSSLDRQRTIAWDRYRDLLDLYYNNGSVYDPFGNIVLQGNLMLMYDKGTYLGTFRSFSVEETGDAPFVFKLSWSFKVEETILKIPSWMNSGNVGANRAPKFQKVGHPPPLTPQPVMSPEALAEAQAGVVEQAQDIWGGLKSVAAFVGDQLPKAPSIPTKAPDVPLTGKQHLTKTLIRFGF